MNIHTTPNYFSILLLLSHARYQLATSSASNNTYSTKHLKQVAELVNPDDKTVLSTYPCPPRECDCWLRENPRRVDVSCYLDILTEDKSFAMFNRTTFPSTMSIYCDDLDIRSSHLKRGMFSSLHAFYFLKISGCHMSYIPKYAFEGMNNINILKIEKANRLVFHNESLHLPGMSRMEFISVISSGLSSAPDLCACPNIWAVNYTDNSLKTFADVNIHCPSANENLLVIDLTTNEIRDLPANLHDIAPNLGRFSASNNNILAINQSTFSELPDLQRLDFEYNKVISFPNEFLGNNSKMHTLMLSGNYVGNIQEGTLHNLESLTAIQLNKMGLTSNVWQQLKPLVSLQVLQLNDNNLDDIEPSTMDGMRNLALLELTANKISTIKAGTFKNQALLQILKLAGNSIPEMKDGVFLGMASLSQLDLRDNKIKNIGMNVFDGVDRLSILNMTNNYIKTLPLFPPSLAVLDVRTNDISSINSHTFWGLTNLLGVNMMFNSIPTIPSSTFQTNSNLQLINIAHNDIEVVEYDAFPKYSLLQSIILHHNKISDIRFLGYSDFVVLRILDLSFNNLESISAAVFPKSLEEIFLTGNNIWFIEGYTFQHLDKLRLVELRSNNIKQLSNLAFEVSRNKLVQVNFWLVGNHFECDCRFAWLKGITLLQNDASDRPYVIRDISSLMCYSVYKTGSGLMKYTPMTSCLCDYTYRCMYGCTCCYELKCGCRYSCPDNCTCYRSNNWGDVNIIDCRNGDLTSVPDNTSSKVTTFDVSGNQLHTIHANKFADLGQFLVEMFLNSSSISVIEESAFAGLTKLTFLDLSHNEITEVTAGICVGLQSLQTLYLNGNKIQYIKANSFKQLKELLLLNLAGNKLQTISGHEFHTLSTIPATYLANNPWSCDCGYLEAMKNFTSANAHQIQDITDVACSSRNTSSDVTDTHLLIELYLPDFCDNRTVIHNVSHIKDAVLDKAAIAAMATVLGLFVIVVAVAVVIFWHRDFIKVWVYVKFGWKFDKANDNADRVYDAFVSYSSLDEEFVVRELVPRLENPENGRHAGYRLCVHYRDFPIGASIAETIITSVESSRRVIIVLSDNFLNSEWCQYEFQTAHHQLIEEKKNRIIMIILGDVQDDKLDHTLKAYMKTRTYVQYGDPWFWQKLEYAMPEIRKNGVKDFDDVNEVNNEEPDILKGIKANNQAAGYIHRENSVVSNASGDFIYIVDNMKNFEADRKGEGKII